MAEITITVKSSIAHYWLEEASKEESFWKSQIGDSPRLVSKSEAEEMLADWRVVIETLKEALRD